MAPDPKLSDEIGQQFVDALNRAVLAEQEADIARIPASVRGRYTIEQLRAMDALELLRLAREAGAP